eukprot:CAMPEP_0174997262 /NCGR_PEP_ID=MMETSP0005-20121125/851_1 /TAXON_ID=420556 /ORGANISM="Ochromonas sp., Strain CCMP1393" /LENGTH=533 /DNA_ID=CAMNT_0016251759 /DNA_START=68 /DNA_END=1668 /DNA_ORIENTATION=-
MKEFLGEIGACETVVYGVSLHIGDALVSEHGSNAIGLLGRDNNLNSYRLAEANTCDIITQVGNFGFNLRHDRCLRVAMNVCYAIVPLCEAVNSNRLIESGACGLVVELIKFHMKDDMFASAAVKCLCALSSLNLILREELGRVGACEYVLDLIPLHRTRPAILQDAVETIMHLSLNPNNTTVLGECGACEVLLESFRNTLVEFELGCEVCTGGMLNLATYGIAAKQNRFRLIDAGAVEELYAVQTSHSTSIRTRENIAKLFQLLGADDSIIGMKGVRSNTSSNNSSIAAPHISSSNESSHNDNEGSKSKDNSNHVVNLSTATNKRSSGNLVGIIHGSEMKGDTLPLQVEVREIVDDSSDFVPESNGNARTNGVSSSNIAKRDDIHSNYNNSSSSSNDTTTIVNRMGMQELMVPQVFLLLKRDDIHSNYNSSSSNDTTTIDGEVEVGETADARAIDKQVLLGQHDNDGHSNHQQHHQHDHTQLQYQGMDAAGAHSDDDDDSADDDYGEDSDHSHDDDMYGSENIYHSNDSIHEI